MAQIALPLSCVAGVRLATTVCWQWSVTMVGDGHTILGCSVFNFVCYFPFIADPGYIVIRLEPFLRPPFIKQLKWFEVSLKSLLWNWTVTFAGQNAKLYESHCE